MRTPSFGEQVPWFKAASLHGNPNFSFSAVAGRVTLLFLCGSAADPRCAGAVGRIVRDVDLFDDQSAMFFGVSTDPSDVEQRRVAQRLPGMRWFLDHDRRVSVLYGVLPDVDADDARYEPRLLVLDHRLRVAGSFAVEDVDRALDLTRALARLGCETPAAPVLIVPRVFEPEICRELIDLYKQEGGGESGFMREIDGVTVPMLDPSFKRRSDHVIRNGDLQNRLRARLAGRLLPEIERAFQYKVTRVERWVIACYDSYSGGFFSPHRDNTTAATAHRRFACTINLNADDYAGGDLRFPEFGSRAYRAPTGGAVIFSCSLLHEALPVTAGQRFAFLPFFYDEEASRLRGNGLQPTNASTAA